MISNWVEDRTSRKLTSQLRRGDVILGKEVSHVDGRTIHFSDGSREIDVGDPIEPWYVQSSA